MSLAIRLNEPTVLASMQGLDDDVDLPLAATEAAEPVIVQSLPEGARLLDYEIIGLIGEGGFGIVYLAYDALLERHIAIKEYMPTTLASRASGSQAVVIKSERHAESFHVGLRSFINEARLLERFDHPSLVKVLHFWEANGTAYMAMPFYEGHTLAQVLETMGRAPVEAEILAWLRPLLQALTVLHAARCFHRDIAPDNILLTPDGPLLLDFGAARRVVLDRADTPTVVFKPGYAPIEQYGEMQELKQGAWTDLYALAAVVYAAVTGRPPIPAVERWVDDTLLPLSEVAQGGYSPPFLATIDAALALKPVDRPATAADFLARLDAVEDAPRMLEAIPEVPEGVAVPALLAVPEPVSEPVVAAVAPVAPPLITDPPSLGTIAQPWERRSRLPLYALLALLLVLGAWGLTALRNRAPAVDAPAERPAATASSPTPAPEAAPVQASAPAPIPPPPMPQMAPVPKAVARGPATAPAVVRPPAPARDAVAPSSTRAAPEAAPSRTADVRQRCGEIIQRASIEPLRSGEAAFLKRECRQ
ncbi:serine/threonine protein kinase [Variovorax sp. PAMC 28711]|uniref:serine/threonine protein kinase n=1 Tax=Variovorax sp. PAMC 28711 TaxID=1795631 RepID=UPI00078B7E2D|nr:serine/threonine-protein kinase [Variovorax sp. PAMC 28711]AMM25150.1 hypothetical protein AX767_12865 [Variovorax sp. PAMC 28711]